MDLLDVLDSSIAHDGAPAADVSSRSRAAAAAAPASSSRHRLVRLVQREEVLKRARLTKQLKAAKAEKKLLESSAAAAGKAWNTTQLSVGNHALDVQQCRARHKQQFDIHNALKLSFSTRSAELQTTRVTD
eukprot:6140786-Pyramimonas_sp.AAC.1